MKQWICVVAPLILFACGAEPDALGGLVLSPRGALAGDLAIYAAREWSAAGFRVSIGYGGIPVTVEPAIATGAACGTPEVPEPEACIVEGGSPCLHLTEGLDIGRARVAVLHEVGHALTARVGHLDCEVDEHIMCAQGGPAGLLPTDRDVDFVLGLYSASE